MHGIKTGVKVSMYYQQLHGVELDMDTSDNNKLNRTHVMDFEHLPSFSHQNKSVPDTRLTAHLTCCLMFDLVICKHRIENDHT